MAVEVVSGKDVERVGVRVCRRQWSVGVKEVGMVVVERLDVVLVGMVAALVSAVFCEVGIFEVGLGAFEQWFLLVE